MALKNKNQAKNYILLSFRVLLSWTLLSYGFAKLTSDQFGVDEKTLNMQLKNIDLFRLSWFLADHQPFKAFIGISQILSGILILINRTHIIGVFISIPIWFNILIWDMTFMGGKSDTFTFRISFYILLSICILFQNLKILNTFLGDIMNLERYQFSYWVYLTLPISAAILELIGALPNAIITLMNK